VQKIKTRCVTLNVLCEQVKTLPQEWFDVLLTLGYINVCINPLIYAARYDVFRKSLRKMLKGDVTASST